MTNKFDYRLEKANCLAFGSGIEAQPFAKGWAGPKGIPGLGSSVLIFFKYKGIMIW